MTNKRKPHMDDTVIINQNVTLDNHVDGLDDTDMRALIKTISQIAQSYSKADSNLVDGFVQVYYKNLTTDDAHQFSAQDLAGMALHHLDMLKQYNRKTPSIEVFNPSAEAEHFYTSHSVIQLVAYNRPFLVDTLLMSLETRGSNVHRLFHTIVDVSWDDDKITDIAAADNSDTRHISLIHCEIDRLESSQLAEIQALLMDKVHVLDSVVADWSEMQERLQAIKGQLANTDIQAAGSPYSQQEIQDFLAWILDENFIFLGYREYRLQMVEDSPELYTVGKSGLGLLSGTDDDVLSESFHTLPAPLKQLLTVPQVLLLSKSSHVSPIHRPVYMDFLGIQKFDDNNTLIGEYRFIGLLTSKAYQLDATQIPLLREKTAQILAKANVPEDGHAYHKILHIINTLPRDDLFQGRIDELYAMVEGVANLQDRKRLRLFTRIDHYQRFVSCLVYIPRAKFNTQFRMKVQTVLTQAFGGTSSGFTTEFDESHHARVHVHVRTIPGHIKNVDTQKLEQKLTKLMQSWEDSFASAILSHASEDTATRLLNQYNSRIPAAYKEQFDARTGVLDIERLDSLKSRQTPLWHLYQSTGSDSNQLNLKVYGRGQPAVLSKVLPILEKFGVEVISAQTYEFGASNQNAHQQETNEHQRVITHDANNDPYLPILEDAHQSDTIQAANTPVTTKSYSNVVLEAEVGQQADNPKNSQQTKSLTDNLWMQEYELLLKHVDTVDMGVVRQQFEHSLEQIWRNNVESDYFNELILTTELDTYDVVILRALGRYMQQAKAPFSRTYIEQTLVKNSAIAVSLVNLFHARMNPSYGEPDSIQRLDRIKAAQQAITDALQQVSSLDEDRILRWYVDLINAMLRTNFYQQMALVAHGSVDQNNVNNNVNKENFGQLEGNTNTGTERSRLSFKFAANDIEYLPKPKPMFEIFVYSPSVEAVHLRGGKVARGGLRWSDRMEDFRTEVLGLVKAQMVKNAVIVPVGSKGGFIVKNARMSDGREAFQKEGIICYQTFLRGMLDITDNIVEGKIVHPVNTVRHDGDDPYLVVAADKGTASFSDIANAVAAEYNFWLDDAFASGGSVGYDHKAMGITARGAWESVKRHFRMQGMDIQNKDDFSVIGIGDMSGDVFGNGMLLSKHIELKAAFNHLHIFIDPTPNTEASYAERERLFKLPRSSWEDYNKSLISSGGGVFSRSDKSIAISEEMKEAFGFEVDSLTPNELIHELLKAPVDLIWNGGIGTYVKSRNESDADVGDRANDAVRVNGEQIQAAVIGEGGNLGCTQRGRIEYAKKGGRIYTDAIDNSGGVNCSDHEVNIKILLGKVVEQGDMTLKQRNELLASMTDTVADLVLRQNYLQPQAIELSVLQASESLSEHQRFIAFLEDNNRLDRPIEYLPSDEEIAGRRENSEGLTRPELAVVLAYGKMWVYDELLASDLPDDAYFADELRKYFPNLLSEKFFEQMQQHRLHREIISTYLTNSVVNRLGIEAIFRLYENTGQSLATIVRAYAIARDVYQISQAWQILESLDNQIDATVQLYLENRVRSLLERSIVWLINSFGGNLQVNDIIERFTASVTELTQDNGFIATNFNERLDKDMVTIQDAAGEGKLTSEQAQVFAMLPYYIDALDTALLAESYQKPVAQVAQLYFKAYEQLHIDWMQARISELPKQSYWERRARHALINELNRLLKQLMEQLLAEKAEGDADSAFELWINAHQDKIEMIDKQIAQLADKPISLATLSVMISEMGRLL